MRGTIRKIVRAVFSAARFLKLFSKIEPNGKLPLKKKRDFRFAKIGKIG